MLPRTAPEIELVLDTPAGVAPGEPPTFGGLEVVTGEVRLRNHGADPITGTVAVFVRRRPRDAYDAGPERGFPEQVLADALTLPPRGTQPSILPFALRLPDRPQGRSHWYVVARFDAGYGETVVTFPYRIALLPPAPVRGLMACLFTVADFVLTSEVYELGAPAAPPVRTVYRFAPPPGLAHLLDGVKLEVDGIALPPDGDHVRGRIVIDPQERRWTDYLRVGGAPHVRRPFDLPASPLAACAPGGAGNLNAPALVTPPYPYLVDAVRDLLRPFLGDEPAATGT